MNKHVVLSFRLGTRVAINSIIGIPTSRQWGGSLNFATNEYSACLLHTKFALHYAPIKQGLQAIIEFLPSEFIFPLQGIVNNATVLMTNMKLSSPESSSPSLVPVLQNNSPKICDTNVEDASKEQSLQYTINDSHKSYLWLGCMI